MDPSAQGLFGAIALVLVAVIGLYSSGRQGRAARAAGRESKLVPAQQDMIEENSRPWLTVTTALQKQIDDLSTKVVALEIEVASLRGLVNTARLYIYSLKTWIIAHVPERKDDIPPVPKGLALFDRGADEWRAGQGSNEGSE